MSRVALGKTTLKRPRVKSLRELKETLDKLAGRKPTLVDQIQDVRAENNMLWMDLLRLALAKAPLEAKQILAEITANDRKVSRLTARLAGGHKK